jgi:hypothetical protein
VRCLAAALLFLLLPGTAAQAQNQPSDQPPDQPVLAAWTQLGLTDSLLVRAITTAPQCPRVSIDGVSQAMAVRARPSADFPVTSCEALAPRSTTAVTVDEAAVPLPRRFIERVVVLGDTGCRISVHGAQACNDPGAWPFAQIAAQAASLRPDLVIHTGDYVFRELPCPEGAAGCAGSPHGDTWDSWNADFFAAARPLLASATWVTARGSREACGAAGEGWFRFLDPHPPVRSCLRFTEPYVVRLGGWQLAVLDSAEAEDGQAPPSLVSEYTQQLASLATMELSNAWLLSSRPIWSVINVPGTIAGPPQLRMINATLQDAARGQISESVNLVLSGHVHLVQAHNFGPSRPPSLVIGNGGAPFAAIARPATAGDIIDGLPIQSSFMLARRHGFALFERDGDAQGSGGWRGSLIAPDGTVMARCRVQRRQLDCSS